MRSTGADTMTVQIRDTEAETDQSGVIIRTVTVSAYCPRCGSRRGAPVRKPLCDDDQLFIQDVWDNPCGHLDYSWDLIPEADRLAAT